MSTPPSTSTSSTTPAADRIPPRDIAVMGAGGITESLAINLTVNNLWMPVFNIGLGISPSILGVILTVLRVWDSFSDPLMGYVTDNTRTRFGRRRPYIVIGATALALLYPLLWRPNPAWGEWGMALYITSLGILVFTCFTVWAMPYHGLLMELTPNYDERTRLSAWCAMFANSAGLLGGWVMAIATSAWFMDAATGKPDIVRGIQTVSFFIAGFVFIVGVMPGLLVKERFVPPKSPSTSDRESFWINLKETFSNRPLWYLNSIVFFNLFGLISTSAIANYINIYYVSRGAIDTASIIEGWKQTAMFFVSIISLPFWTWVSRRLDKKTTLAIILSGTILGHLLNLVCLNPRYPYLQIIPSLFWSGVASAVWLMVPSMKMDIADYDELHTHRRREGSLNSVLSWFIKMALAMGVGCSGFLLQATGFDASIGDVQPPEVLQRMVQVYIVVPLILWIPVFYFLWKYPLNRAVMAKVRAELEQRRRDEAGPSTPTPHTSAQ